MLLFYKEIQGFDIRFIHTENTTYTLINTHTYPSSSEGYVLIDIFGCNLLARYDQSFFWFKNVRLAYFTHIVLTTSQFHMKREKTGRGHTDLLHITLILICSHHIRRSSQHLLEHAFTPQPRYGPTLVHMEESFLYGLQLGVAPSVQKDWKTLTINIRWSVTD